MTTYAFLNHQFVPASKALININTHALHYGCGYFGGIRGYWNQHQNTLFVFRLNDHIKRFENSGKILGLKSPPELKNLKKIIITLLKKNRFCQNTYIRPLVFVSDPILTKFDLGELNTTLAVTTVPLGHYLDVSKGVKVMISSWVRQPSPAIPPQAKPTGIYLNTALAHTQAKAQGFDEAILLTLDGFVSEGSAENIFLVKSGRLITPDSASDILLGITRRTIIDLAQKELGLKTIEKKVSPRQLFQADEAFFTGTGAEVTHIRQINRRVINQGKIGPLTQKLQRLYFDIVSGQNSKYSHWLTPIKYS